MSGGLAPQPSDDQHPGIGRGAEAFLIGNLPQFMNNPRFQSQKNDFFFRPEKEHIPDGFKIVDLVGGIMGIPKTPLFF